MAEIKLRPAMVVARTNGNLTFAAPREWLAFAGISTGDPLYCDMMISTGSLVYGTQRREWSRKTTVTLQNTTPYIGISVFHSRPLGLQAGDRLELEIEHNTRNLVVRPLLTLSDE
jgi:hypothetical protein